MNKVVRYLQNTKYTPEELRDAVDWMLEQPEILPAAPKQAKLLQLASTLEEAKHQLVQGDAIQGLSTGYHSLDMMVGGIRPSSIMVLFGDTGHGKSQLAQNISLNLALKGTAVLFVGLEMTNTENTARFLQMLGSEERVAQLPIVYPANPDIGYRDVEALFLAAEREAVGLVVIDHLHAMPLPTANNKADALEAVMYELRRLVVKYAIPVLLVSHISRQGTRKGAPELPDLKGSGAIEQVATVALAVWRDMDLDEGQQTLKVVLRKNRHRSRKYWHTELAILPNQRLADQVDLAGIPGWM